MLDNCCRRVKLKGSDIADAQPSGNYVEGKYKIFPFFQLEIPDHYPVDENEFEVAREIMLFQGVITALEPDFSRFDKIVDYFPEIKVNFRFDFKSDMEIHPY